MSSRPNTTSQPRQSARGSHRAPASWRSLALLCSFALLCGMLSLRAADVSVRANIEPSQITLGRSTQLTLQISGASSSKITPPQVDNLDIAKIGHQSSWQMVNGLISQTTFYFYQVVPYAEGQFTIPAFQVEISGQKYTTAPMTLRVVADPQAAQNSNPSPSPNVSNLPAGPSGVPGTASNLSPSRPTPPPTPRSTASGEAAMLRITPSRTEMYVGQHVPVTIRLYVRADRPAELRSLPRLLNDAFTLTPPSKEVQQDEETVDGVSYRTATWNTAMTPVKTGDYTISTEVDLRLAERDRQNRPAGFDDPFFDSFFSQYHMVERTLKSSPQSWKVLPLPTDSRPDNFSGAIGQFTCTVKAQPDKVKVGEPITLDMTVAGKGNFDRIAPPMLTNTDGFKVYQPTSKIESETDSGFEGKKIFTQAIIPNRAGVLPSITFNYFDPDLKKYVVTPAETPRIVITDAPAPAVVAASTPADTTSGATHEDETKSPDSSLVPIKVDLTPFAANFEPVFVQPGFLAAQSVPLLVLMAGFLVARHRRKLESDPDFARTHEANRAVRQQLEAMNTAVARNDAAAFFTAARRAVQQRLAERWRVKTDDVTYDLISRQSVELAKSLKNLFLVADEIAYSGEAHTDVTLTEWQKAIVALLSRLEKKP